jgi:hypothetical protein
MLNTHTTRRVKPGRLYTHDIAEDAKAQRRYKLLGAAEN